MGRDTVPFFKEKRKLIYIFASMDSKEKRGKQRRSGRSQGEAGEAVLDRIWSK